MGLVVVWALFACTSPVVGQPVMAPDGRMDFGSEGIDFPPATRVNTTLPRTAELLGEAIRGEKQFWYRRAQWVQELGRCKLPEVAVYLREAMADPVPQVRAQAAAAAGESEVEALLGDVEKLLDDKEPAVRREAVAAADALSKLRTGDSPAVLRGLNDSDPLVMLAAVNAVRTAGEAGALAAKLPGLSADLQVAGLEALGRAKARDQAALAAGFLDKTVPLRAAAVLALSHMKATDQLAAVLARLTDEHPTVRRLATDALAELATIDQQHEQAMKMLKDPDATVRTAAAKLLNPLPDEAAAQAILSLLDDPHRPLHAALRAALIHPATPQVKKLVIEASAGLLDHANPRRREDGSYVLGRLRSDAAFEKHLALLNVPKDDPVNVDWPLITQVAESLGLIGDQRAAESLVALAEKAPTGYLTDTKPKLGNPIDAMGAAIVAAGRLRYKEILPTAVRLASLSPRLCPGQVRTASLWCIGVINPEHSEDQAGILMHIYAGMEEGLDSQYEALKAVGNLKLNGLADRMKQIGSTDGDTKLRWIGHWAYDRITGQTTPYEPPQRKWNASVSIEATQP